MSEIVFNVQDEAVDFHALNFQSADVRESGEISQIAVAECLRHEPTVVAPLFCPDLFYEWHQT